MFLFILIIAIGVACCIRKKKQREEEKNAMDHLWETNPTIQVNSDGKKFGNLNGNAKSSNFNYSPVPRNARVLSQNV